MNSKEHINLYRRRSEYFTLNSCKLRCLHVGVLQNAIELRKLNMDMLTGPKCGILPDPLRDCIGASGKFNSRSVYPHLTNCRFGAKQFSAVDKFARRGLSVSRDQVTAAVIK